MSDLTRQFRKVFPKRLKLSDIVFVCIGTDRSTGDSLGPLVGTVLQRMGYAVIGTLNAPCHAENMTQLIADIPPKKTIVAIDACLGRNSSIGMIEVARGPLRPGAGVGKVLPPVGDYHISGIVNVGGFMEYFILQNTRLSLVVEIAEQIVSAIANVFPISIAEVAAGRMAL